MAGAGTELFRVSVMIQRCADAEQVSRTGAEWFVRLCRESITARGRFLVALAGGSTPKRLYQMLAEAPLRDEVDWSRVEVFWGDERSVPPDHSDSNYGMATAALLSRVPIPATQIHRPRAEDPDLAGAASDYENEIARVSGSTIPGPPPAFDLVLLGMGGDGHTASLFPHTSALKEIDCWVVANQVPQLNTWRVTMTYPMLNAARQVIFLVAGADKADRLVEVLEGPPDLERLPSQGVQPAGQLLWLVDEKAAARLKSAG